MGGQVDRLGETTLNLISSMEGTSGCFSEIEKGFTGIRTMLDNQQAKHS